MRQPCQAPARHLRCSTPACNPAAAGWEPLLVRLQAGTPHHYQAFFHTTGAALLQYLRGWRGDEDDLAELGDRLQAAMPLSAPPAGAPSFTPGIGVRGRAGMPWQCRGARCWLDLACWEASGAGGLMAAPCSAACKCR